MDFFLRMGRGPPTEARASSVELRFFRIGPGPGDEPVDPLFRMELSGSTGTGDTERSILVGLPFRLPGRFKMDTGSFPVDSCAPGETEAEAEGTSFSPPCGSNFFLRMLCGWSTPVTALAVNSASRDWRLCGVESVKGAAASATLDDLFTPAGTLASCASGTCWLFLAAGSWESLVSVTATEDGDGAATGSILVGCGRRLTPMTGRGLAAWLSNLEATALTPFTSTGATGAIDAIDAIGAVRRSTRATVWLAMAVSASMRAVSSSVLMTAAGLVEAEEAPEEAAVFLHGTARPAAAGDGDFFSMGRIEAGDSVGGRIKAGGWLVFLRAARRSVGRRVVCGSIALELKSVSAEDGERTVFNSPVLARRRILFPASSVKFNQKTQTLIARDVASISTKGGKKTLV